MIADKNIVNPLINQFSEKIYAQSSDQAISRQVGKLVLHKLSFYKLKGATELNFMHEPRVVIILFSTGFYKSAFSSYSFGKTRFSSFSVLAFRFIFVFRIFGFQVLVLLFVLNWLSPQKT